MYCYESLLIQLNISTLFTYSVISHLGDVSTQKKNIRVKVKVKEEEKLNTYLDLAGELKS